jgi:pyridoxine kinase
LSDVQIDDMNTLGLAVHVLHQRYGVPHVVITSVSLPHPDHPVSSLSVVGSTMTSDRRARPFKIVFPAIDAYFSGTGDMFAALMVVRMREAVLAHTEEGEASRGASTTPTKLAKTPSWVSDDATDAMDLPLARAAEKVLASMHEVLSRTREAMERDMAKVREEMVHGSEEEDRKKLHLLQSKAAELRLVRHVDSLRFPQVKFKAQRMQMEDSLGR